MKKLFAIIAVATMSAGAQAATEYKWNGSINQTFNMNSNPGFVSTGGAVENNWLQKNQLGVSAKANDKLMGYMNFMHVGLWGGAGTTPGAAYSSAATTKGIPNTTAFSPQNTVVVSQAWMWWKATDSLSIKSGRNSNAFGDGFVISKNEGLPYPFFNDSLMARWSSDFLDLDFGGSKSADTGLVGNVGTDTELVFYGFNASIKSLPDMFKKFDLFLLQANADAGITSAVAAPSFTAGGSWNMMLYGLFTKLDVSMIDLTANLVMESGKQKITPEATLSAMAYDVELGVNLPEFMKARIYVGMHNSSGENATTTDKYEGYQPLFYDVAKYSVAGIWGIGNLSNMKVGIKLATSDETSFGFEMNMASRASKDGGVSIVANSLGNSFQPSTTAVDATQTALATVMGLWAKHDYGSGFNISAGLNMISLGSYYKPTGTTVADGMGVRVNGTYNF